MHEVLEIFLTFAVINRRNVCTSVSLSAMLSLQPPTSPLHWSALRDIYMEAFPPEERRTFEDIRSKHADPSHPLSVLCIFRDGTVVGMLSWWQLPGFAYIEHFAVSSSLRGGGTGSRALSAFIAAVSIPVVLEVERPGANAMADRRIGFYRRNGFVPLSDYDYVQPPYSPSLPAVPLLLMSTNPVLRPDEVASLLYSVVYGATPEIS